MRRRAKRLTALSLLAALVAGCATAPSAPADVQPLAAGDLPRTLAVLPFVPLPEKEEQTRVLGNMVYGVLTATPWEVLKPQVVEERLVRAGLADPRELGAKDPIEVARILRVEALLYGEMTHWDRLYLLAYSQVAAGAAIRLVDGRSGRTLFERREVARSHEGGVPGNPLSAAITVIQTAFKLREIELVRACDDLVRVLMKGVPEPPAGVARRPPAFTSVVSDGAGRTLKAGDTLTVIAQGQRGAIGSFDLVPLAKSLPLEESTEGIFVGRYTVKPGDNASEAYVAARLADGAGRVSEREDVLGRFAVDTVPPAPPSGVSVRLTESALQLAWTRNTEADLAGYRVYRSDSPLTGFALAGTTESPGYREELTGLAHYRISAVDQAGNESPPSPSLTLPVLGSPLRGAITRETYLVPAHSPYLVEGSVSIEEGATLHVLPGVVIRFAPGAEGILVRDGALVARGTAERRITFTSASARPAPGDFRTAVHVQARSGQTSTLERVAIEHGGVGLRVTSGALEVLRAEITGNLQGGIEVADTGVLKLSESRVAGHPAGGGVSVVGFGRAVLRRNAIVDNAWAVVNYSGSPVDARENWWGRPAPGDALFLGEVDRGDPLTAEAPRE
ncbi:MAG: DUF799 family lipoprotein [Candidatus Rokubacteria bacterium]|nr:DUF799 family lipoprotein [Candidatus Rokubacteria bacterium]